MTCVCGMCAGHSLTSRYSKTNSYTCYKFKGILGQVCTVSKWDKVCYTADWIVANIPFCAICNVMHWRLFLFCCYVHSLAYQLLLGSDVQITRGALPGLSSPQLNLSPLSCVLFFTGLLSSVMMMRLGLWGFSRWTVAGTTLLPRTLSLWYR